MSSSNKYTYYKTLVDKNDIPKGSTVVVTNPGDYDKNCTCSLNGVERDYLAHELQDLLVIVHSGPYINHIVEKTYNNNNDFKGNMHLTKNVRGCEDYYRLYEQVLYTGSAYEGHIYDHYIGFDYKERELSDKEIVDIILEEIIYGIQPSLQSTSLVGTTAKGIDEDPNYHNGHYLLPNNKNYTVTWCRGTIKIREGIDGGWYKGKDVVGREIFTGEMDWERYKEAKIIQQSIKFLANNPRKVINQFPNISEELFRYFESKGIYKLSNEF